jgi:hypothetical protein
MMVSVRLLQSARLARSAFGFVAEPPYCHSTDSANRADGFDAALSIRVIGEIRARLLLVNTRICRGTPLTNFASGRKGGERAPGSLARGP